MNSKITRRAPRQVSFTGNVFTLHRSFRTGAGLVLAISAFSLLSSCVNAAEPAAPTTRAVATDSTSKRFDFGASSEGAAIAVEPQYLAVGPELRFSSQRGYGWLENDDLLGRDRSQPDALRRDFIFSNKRATFRVTGLTPGLYRLTVVCGDTQYQNHATQIRIAGDDTSWPTLNPALGEFLTLTGTTMVRENTMDISFDSPTTPPENWVVNALALEKTTTAARPTVSSSRGGSATETPLSTAATAPSPSGWAPVLTWADPTKPLLERFRQTAAKQPPANFRPTGLTRRDYLKLITAQVDFWKTQQNATGAIIDPYRKEEFQYSTPAYALAAALTIREGARPDLVESAAKAMDWATRTLSERKAATQHEDFYPPLLAHALPILKPLVAPQRAAGWEADIRGINPTAIYRQPIGLSNWNLVAASGEFLFQRLGLRDADNQYVNQSIASQGVHFQSPYGLYLEGPMAYDAFPRLWVSDIVAQGYEGSNAAELTEVLRRGAITSLFLQSPWGELPAGHRSAHHQWNEAEQCVIFEIYAAQALKNGDAALAGLYKRAAHLALSSMQRWVRPSGEMQIIKNWVDPAKGHSYEVYSGHSQYNLLPMAMLAIAYDYAKITETIAEAPSPADAGGFVVELRELHKIIANAGGTYIEIDPKSDPNYDATGLIRVHVPGLSPQLGPSDSVVKKPKYNLPKGSATPATTGIGVSWKAPDGNWRRLGELGEANIKKWTLSHVSESPQRVAFDVTYEGELLGVSRIVESYIVTPGRVELTTEIAGYDGPLRYVWPVLADDGRTPSSIEVRGGTVAVSQDGGKTAQTFTAQGAETVQVEAPRYANHNGWARVAVAEYPRGGKISLVIAPKFSSNSAP